MTPIFRNILSVFVAVIGIMIPMTAFAVIIEIDAGEPQTICYGDNLDLTSLGAFISGDVDDGIWFSTGDGVFLPGSGTNVVFSIGTYYQPGPADLAAGTFDLILVSDDPDGIGPMVEVSDVVTITLMSAPPFACNGEVNVSLSETCEQKVDIYMVVPNPAEPVDMYTIVLFDESGDTILDNTLTVDHIGQEISYIVGHSCTNNTCEGSLTAHDYIAPFINCLDATVLCSDSTDPEVAGLPIPFYATALYIGDNTYTVTDLDACGIVTLTYDEDVTPMACTNGLSSIITRYWEASDVNGNQSNCTQTIFTEVIGLDSVVAPPNYDNIDEPALECGGAWDTLPEGNPDTSVTGMPTFGGCDNMEATMTDINFDYCGGGFKVLRKWLVIDWCTSDHLDINQIIQIKDTQAPIYDCPSDTIIGTDAYTCVNAPYQAMFMENVSDCSDWDYEIAIIDDNGIDQSAAYVDGLMLKNMSPGTYTLQFHLTDVCGNGSNCNTTITVIDDKAPFAICDQYTKISIQSTGEARLFATSLDESSYDNCGIESMHIMKMTDECGGGADFAHFVDFCCEEVGDTIMVQFRVTDTNGHSNTCMVEVRVEDKIAPEITCPSDLTISCDFDIYEDDLTVFGVVRASQQEVEDIIIDDNYNNGIAGQDGYFTDNCNATLTTDHTYFEDCGEGTLTRTFTVTDDFGTTASCVQTITIVNDNLFTADDITWPANHYVTGCDTLQATPEIAGVPLFASDHCSEPAYSYDDQIFNLADGACIKILRYWTVIDWCQFDNQSSVGTWSYIQEIKLFNNEAPVFDSCTDVEVCDYSTCGSHNLVLGVSATDDCTEPEFLEYSWSIDIEDNGVVNASGIGDTITRLVPYGTHRVYWDVSDGCGNFTSCDYLINVKDCKLPSPYCLGSVTTTVMPSSGSLEIWAKDYDLGSSDNCTAKEDLLFSFSENVADSSLVLTCADLPNGVAAVLPIEIWVTDENGNQDYCAVQIILQDNSDICLDGDANGLISGVVQTRNNVELEEATVSYYTILEDYNGSEMTSADGVYAFDDIPNYLPYGVKPSFEGGRKLDVNSIDLVKIQRHLLQIEPLETPYDIIAADVSRNDKVQSSDLLIIRKYILGIITEYPQAPKWDFVPASYAFPDSLDPFGYVDSMEIASLTEPLDTIDWVAVRMGNVDGGFSFLNGKQEIETRNDGVELRYKTEPHEAGFKTEIYFGEDMNFDALQFSISTGGILDVNSELLSSDEYFIANDQVNIVHLSLNGSKTIDEPILEILHAEEHVGLTSEAIYSSFLYDGNEKKIFLTEELLDLEEVQEDRLTVHGNPFSQSLSFSIKSKSDIATANIYNLKGQLIFTTSISTNETTVFDHLQSLQSGTYILEVKTAEDLSVEKIVKL